MRAASRGIGTGIGLIGLGIGLKFLSDTSTDIRKKTKKKDYYKMPKFEPVKPFKYKKSW
jgi:hypothetical protein